MRLAVAPERDIQSALIAARHRALAGRAETRVAEPRKLPVLADRADLAFRRSPCSPRSPP